MKKIIALAALAAAISTSAHAVTNDYLEAKSGNGDVLNTTQHSVLFSVNSAYVPMTFVDEQVTDPTALAQPGPANRVIVASKFAPENGHQYEVGTPVLTGANSAAQVTTVFSSANTSPTLDVGKKFVKVNTDGDIFILLTQTDGAGLNKGSTTASYTVTDYAS
ncbi:hypothetical protein NL87_05215 [Salmonella enterica]|nr:hypothetical protein [Salmonella enterica subsp. enterica]EAW9005030.1 hypothetical protein [Salmonella enterica]EAY5636433.1 hypothetical protein [Salmonella enterica]EBP3785956.1 hypothetical protein [Salmonella enterica subsp. enterica]EBP3793325.1 hypothetical protein [Salmonella enterica subsp. enterica]